MDNGEAKALRRIFQMEWDGKELLEGSAYCLHIMPEHEFIYMAVQSKEGPIMQMGLSGALLKNIRKEFEVAQRLLKRTRAMRRLSATSPLDKTSVS